MALRLGGRSKFQQPFDPITAILFKMIQALTFFFVLAVMFMNPEAKKGIIDPKAEYIITVNWPDNSPDDIDLWVEDPSGAIIWFRNREAGLVHLDRDDRGGLNNSIVVDGKRMSSPIRQETVSIRGVIAGEYTVNVNHYLATTNAPVPVSVKVEKVNPTVEVVHYDTFNVDHAGQEKTAVRFRVADNGRVTDVTHQDKSLIQLTRSVRRSAK